MVRSFFAKRGKPRRALRGWCHLHRWVARGRGCLGTEQTSGICEGSVSGHLDGSLITEGMGGIREGSISSHPEGFLSAEWNRQDP